MGFVTWATITKARRILRKNISKKKKNFKKKIFSVDLDISRSTEKNKKKKIKKKFEIYFLRMVLTYDRNWNGPKARTIRRRGMQCVFNMYYIGYG